jgi:hypothetical protein
MSSSIRKSAVDPVQYVLMKGRQYYTEGENVVIFDSFSQENAQARRMEGFVPILYKETGYYKSLFKQAEAILHSWEVKKASTKPKRLK